MYLPCMLSHCESNSIKDKVVIILERGDSQLSTPYSCFPLNITYLLYALPKEHNIVLHQTPPHLVHARRQQSQ